MVSFTLQEVRDSQRPHAGMGPSPRALLISIFEKKAQRNKIFFYLKVMGTTTRTRLYISKRSIWKQRSWKFFHRSGSPNQELSLLSFESLKYHQFSLTMVAGCVWKKIIIIIISFQIHLSHILNFKKYLILCYLKF